MNHRSFVVLISGRGSNLQALIHAVQSGQIKAEISAVISNRRDAGGLGHARRAGIETRLLEARAGEDRNAYDERLGRLIDSFEPDLVVLAGFMRILGERFIEHFNDRILNIHPSLLPAYKGLNTHRRVLESRELRHGASVHVVSNELDSGAVVIQAAVAVREGDDEDTLAARVLEQEHVIYPLAVQWYFDDKLKISGGQPCIDNQPIDEPIKWTYSNTANQL